MRLVGPDGRDLVTGAQDAKARRYVADGKVREAWPAVTPEVPWGARYRTRRRYVLDPIPGCRQLRHVAVVEHYDEADRLLAVDYRCDCQRAAGTTSTVPTTCSHALAVHRYRLLGRAKTAGSQEAPAAAETPCAINHHRVPRQGPARIE